MQACRMLPIRSTTHQVSITGCWRTPGACSGWLLLLAVAGIRADAIEKPDEQVCHGAGYGRRPQLAPELREQALQALGLCAAAASAAAAAAAPCSCLCRACGQACVQGAARAQQLLHLSMCGAGATPQLGPGTAGEGARRQQLLALLQLLLLARLLLLHGGGGGCERAGQKEEGLLLL